MPKKWIEALENYRYRVSFKNYKNAGNYPGFFEFELSSGDRYQTKQFESHFRELANSRIEVWLEVVYWKMYSQGGRRDYRTKAIASHFELHNISPQVLFKVCQKYIQAQTKENLRAIMKELGIKSNSIAVAATFPAFLKPDLFPMVDTRIAKWVGISMDAHNKNNIDGPNLIRPRYLDTKYTVLTLSDIDFIRSWITWCRHKASQLNAITSIEWCARNVEMAVFNAWGDRDQPHPSMILEVLN